MKIIRRFSFFILFAGITSPVLATGWVDSLKVVLFNLYGSNDFTVPDSIVGIISSYSKSPFEGKSRDAIVDMYRDELKRSVSTDEEPTYIEKIQRTRSFLIESFIVDISRDCKRREDWINLAQNILNAMSAINHIAFDAAKTVTNKELSNLKLTDPQQIGLYAYRSSELELLIYLLQHEREIFDAVYKASSDNLTMPNKAFFNPTAWKEFREKHFGKLSPEQYLFLRPYLEEIDWIVENKIGPPKKI